MKITTKQRSYEQVTALPRPKHRNPLRPMFLLQLVIRILSIFDLYPTKFRYTEHGMEKLGKKEPCLILMNHSSFLDLKIASRIFFPRRYNIVSTHDSFVGFFMSLLMRLIGCIPTRKFVTDVTLIRDMEYALKKKKCSVLMYPEAGYTFDGRTTVLPRKLGVLVKKLGVPLVTVITQGAFARDPLYNCLQKRKVRVHADVTCLATAREVKEMSVEQIDKLIAEAFSFDGFRYQQENGVIIDEPFRADGLHRILYQCPHCGTEGSTEGKGTALKCHSCGKEYVLTEDGFLKASDGDTRFDHVPDWYDWQRQQVREELEAGAYRLECDVDIAMLVDYKALYTVGQGRLIHDGNGFRLTGCGGRLDYTQSPLASYTLNSDYYWYEIGDVIGLGNSDALYYCFPKSGNVVTKARLAAEELYKLKKQRQVRTPV